MDDVKPCPFCGNAPYVAEEIDPYEWWFVACRTPGCILPIAGGCTSIESAIARWNRRAALASMPSLNDEMRSVILNEAGAYQSEDDLYAALCRAARASAPAQQWISVKDRLPEEPGEYLLFRPAAHLPPASDPNVTIREFYGRGKVGNDRFGGAHAVTHWMPLPEAPASSVASKAEPTS